MWVAPRDMTIKHALVPRVCRDESMFFCPLTGICPFLSGPDGISNPFLPPAGDFSRQRKVTKSWLRTKVLRTPFNLLWGVCPVISLDCAADGCKGVGVPLSPRFSALPWWLLEFLLLKPSPAGGRWHGEAVTDEGSQFRIAPSSVGLRPPASPQGGSLRMKQPPLLRKVFHKN